MANKKHILIAVCGLTPQVITETLYYFFVIRKQPLSEVYVITTISGKEKIKNTLFDGDILEKLRERFKKLKVKKDFIFNEENINIVTDSNGNPLQDIKTIEHNEQVAEVIWKVIEQYTKREDVVVHCSIAGGRKTMGVYAGIIMSLLGRKDDTLTHILVDTEKESSDFFFPEKPEDENKLNLAEIPYVRLRELLNISEKKLNFVTRVRDYQKELDEKFSLQRLELNYENKVIDGGNCGKVKLSEREFFVYTILAERRKSCSCEEGCSNCFLDITSLINESEKHYERFDRYFSTKRKFDKSKIYEVISRIKNKIEGSNFFRKDLINIKRIGRNKNYKYGIGLSQNKIVLTGQPTKNQAIDL